MNKRWQVSVDEIDENIVAVPGTRTIFSVVVDKQPEFWRILTAVDADKPVVDQFDGGKPIGHVSPLVPGTKD